MDKQKNNNNRIRWYDLDGWGEWIYIAVYCISMLLMVIGELIHSEVLFTLAAWMGIMTSIVIPLAFLLCWDIWALMTGNIIESD